MDDVVAECGAVCTCLVSCFAGLDVVLAAVPAAGATLPTVLAADVAFNGVVDGGAARMTAGGGGMELESEDDDTSAFTATDGISTCEDDDEFTDGAIVVVSSLTVRGAAANSFVNSPSSILMLLSPTALCNSLDTSGDVMIVISSTMLTKLC